MSDILALHHKKYRQARGMFFAEGRKIISELMHSTFQVDAVFGSSQFIGELSGLPASAGVSFEIVDDKELRKMSALSNPQDGFALCRIPQVKEPQYQSDKVYLYLDAIRDPGNMGSLIRLADWFGLEAVICSSDCVEWTNPKVIQASMGSFIRKTPFVETGDPGSFLAGKHRVIAADLAGEDLYLEFNGFAGIFIISNEANGLSPVLEPLITSKVHIPSPTGSAESLNAATAAAVLLGELTRRQLTGQEK